MPKDMKEPLGRYVLKLSIAAFIAAVAKNNNYLLSFAFWVSLYAVFAVVYAVLKRDPLSREHMNHWDEAMWLGVTAFLLQLAGRAI